MNMYIYILYILLCQYILCAKIDNLNSDILKVIRVNSM